MANTLSPILHIPAELTEHALVLSHPRDVASFAQTCRTARALVYEAHDQHLWRNLFLEQPFDDPRRSVAASAAAGGSTASESVDWKKELQRRVHAMCVIQKIDAHPPQLAAALRALIAIACGAPPMPELSDKSKDLVWLADLTREHSVFDADMSAEDWTPEEQQQRMELWTYIGWRDSVLNADGAGLLETRNASRRFVYDMRNYARENLWGPFLPDKSGHVNWKHVQSIITIIHCNLSDLGDLWSNTRPPTSYDAIRAYSAPGAHQRDPRDWAGVGGTWRRFVCFMDYRDLFSYNFSRRAYNSTFFDDDEFQEATRLIELSLRVTKVVEVASPSGSSNASPKSSPTTSAPTSGPLASSVTPEALQPRPVIHFAGTSRGGNGNESRVRGSVRMTPDGRIRWRFASIYDGHSQWSSEGVQIGNVCSAAGVVGTWTGANHEDGDPAGPFWLWKVEDDHPSHLNK
ncbi:hypothetical protein DFH11DRAFT_66104 [Phellopilus nigrolimitatus]|nr:hypothetical protein DFH11DRAFT_66104 [Phellopilus nigrolimitatus]